MTRDPSEAARDSALSYDTAIAAKRELAIRSHQIRPRPDNSQELRWWLEGPCLNEHLETVK